MALPYAPRKMVPYLQQQVNKHTRITELIEEALTSLVEDVGAIYEESKDAELAEAIKRSAGELVNLSQQVREHQEMVQQVQATCEARPDEEDGSFSIVQTAEQALARIHNSSFQAELDPKYKEVMGVLDLEPSQEQPADPSLQDDDIQIESDGNRLAKNAVCPISGKAILELKEPVTDQMGFVYEKSEIMKWLRQQRVGRQGALAPFAGTTHYISEASLQRAHRVVRAQKEAQRGRHGAPEVPDDAVDVD